jgi:hypothetical protein
MRVAPQESNRKNVPYLFDYLVDVTTNKVLRAWLPLFSRFSQPAIENILEAMFHASN